MNQMIRVGVNLPYSDRPLPTKAWRQIDAMHPEQFTLTSFASEDTLARLCDRYPDAAIVVRPRTGPQHQPWPTSILDYRSWPSERSLRDCLGYLVGRSMDVRLVMGNEPRNEWAPPWPGPEQNEVAARQYSRWYLSERPAIKATFPGVPVAPAPHDQGDDNGTAIWLDVMEEAGCYAEGNADFLADHCYYTDQPFDAESWGGRWRVLRQRFPHLGAVWNLETNDNGNYGDGDTQDRANLLKLYILRCRGANPADLACVSLFTIKGAPDDDGKPQWWFLGDRMIAAAAEAMAVEVATEPPLPVAVQPAPEPAPPEPEPVPEPEPAPEPEPVMALPEGIDVSNNNGRIDWDAVAGAGITFAFMKATEGIGFQDATLPRNWREVKRIGLARGAYDFGRPDRAMPETEAQYFLDYVLGQGLETGDMLALDLEDFQGSLLRAIMPVGEWTLRWLQYVERSVGFAPLLYTSAGVADQFGFAGYPDLARFGLWLASWRSTMPAPPNPWNLIAFWQYGVASAGTVPGVGEVDVNRFNGDAVAIPLYGKPAAQPQPVPAPSGYAVGQGILDKMAEHGDQPASDEVYAKGNGRDAFSEAYGTSGARYVYIPSLGRTYRFDPAA
jgi:GH25 family lysozyme M1 (1,4-beta-N-acetylmuramidase)